MTGHDLVFATLDIAPPPPEFLTWVKSLDENSWWWDSYRTCHMLNLYTTGQGQSGAKMTGLRWQPNVPDFFIKYMENNLWPMIGGPTRAIIIRTLGPEGGNADHIDCSKEQFGTIQHKFRTVLEGYTGGLYFMNGNDRRYIPEVDTNVWYVMDGSWPHGQRNTKHGYKYTLCLGAPFNGYEDLSKYPIKEIMITKGELTLPEDYTKLFRNYGKSKTVEQY